MLQKMLGAHPDIHTLSEPWIALHPLFALRREDFAASFDLLVGKTAVVEFLRQLPEKDEAYCEGLRRMLGHLYDQALAGSGKPIFLDKTPRYYFIIPELRRVFPRARIVFLLRNPLAVLASILKTWCQSDPTIELSYSRYDLMDAPRMILDGIRQAGPEAIVTRYDDLVTNPEHAIRRLCDCLEIAFHPGMIEYGAEQNARWRYGDQGTVYAERRPVTGPLDQWRETLREQPAWANWARGYLAALGPEVVNGLGYDYGQLHAAFPAGGDPGEWLSVMQPPEEVLLDRARQDLLARTTELEKTAGLLAARTAEMELNAGRLQSRTADLVDTRTLLIERTAALDRNARELQSRTTELVETRALLIERTAALDRNARELQSRTTELVETRALLIERTAELERIALELRSRTAELVEARALLIERTAELERTALELKSRTADLVDTSGLTFGAADRNPGKPYGAE